MIGNYSQKLDNKARLTIPAKLRKELGSVIVISAGFDNTLEIRTEKAFKQWSETLTSKGNLNSTARNLQRLILGNSFDIKIDNAGRILLPKALLEMAKIKKDVTLIGIGDKVEVHASEQWDKLISDGSKLSKTLEELAEELDKESK